MAVQRRPRLGERLGELGDRRPHGTRDVEPRPLTGGGGAPVAAAETERRGELGDELVELVLDRRVRTGLYCSYEPIEGDLRWIVQS